MGDGDPPRSVGVGKLFVWLAGKSRVERWKGPLAWGRRGGVRGTRREWERTLTRVSDACVAAHPPCPEGTRTRPSWTPPWRTSSRVVDCGNSASPVQLLASEHSRRARFQNWHPAELSQCEARSSDGTMSEAGDAFGEVEDGFASDLAGSDDNLESVHDEEEEEDGEDLMDNVLECVPSHPTKNLISAPPIARCEKPKPKPDPIPKPRIHPRTPHPSLTTTPPTHPR